MGYLNRQDGLTRRDFNVRMGAAAVGVAVGGARILGANDRVVVANIGIRGQGN